jgi:hypothetical protein
MTTIFAVYDYHPEINILLRPAKACEEGMATQVQAIHQSLITKVTRAQVAQSEQADKH